VFVIMTFDDSPQALAEERARLRAAWRAPLGAAALILAPLAAGLLAGAEAPGAAGGPVPAARLGALLFGPWAVAVEIASALLLAALLGARALGRGDDAP
jgi:NADH-quinone oxidoreductase subunit J